MSGRNKVSPALVDKGPCTLAVKLFEDVIAWKTEWYSGLIALCKKFFTRRSCVKFLTSRVLLSGIPQFSVLSQYT